MASTVVQGLETGLVMLMVNGNWGNVVSPHIGSGSDFTVIKFIMVPEPTHFFDIAISISEATSTVANPT
ncbi:hypothetical protein CU097_004620, partial [Rhizopus azygosporus]